jgi:hypothetical protein
MKRAHFIFAALAALAASGCGSSLPKLPTTGSLLGGSNSAKENLNPNDPVARTMGVAATSARALKCGYNFDPTKLKSQYLAHENAANPADGEKLSKVYDTAFAGVTKAIASQQEEYCTPDRTARIKEALNRNLAGDYTPPRSEAPVDDGGLFSGWGGSNSNDDNATSEKMKQIFQ